MRVIVCGGRDYSDREFLYRQLDRLHAEHGFTVVIHGAARGADTLADEWATERGIAAERYPADWDAHGKAAGPIRNQVMLDRGADLVVAFPGGKGTMDMTIRAAKSGLKVIKYFVPFDELSHD